MGASGGKPGSAITGINVTPLVDVMLVLLIIFMVTGNFIKQEAIKVELPQASTADVADNTKNIAFVIDAYQNLYMDGQKVELKNLNQNIKAIKEKSTKNIQALISADKNAKHGNVIQIIDLLRKNEIYDFAFSIDLDSSQTEK